jgi:hypothetical protein
MLTCHMNKMVHLGPLCMSTDKTDSYVVETESKDGRTQSETRISILIYLQVAHMTFKTTRYNRLDPESTPR